MCTLIYRSDGSEISNVGQLRREWPVVLMSDLYDGVELSADACLCGVDVEASAAESGVPIEMDHVWGDYTILSGGERVDD